MTSPFRDPGPSVDLEDLDDSSSPIQILEALQELQGNQNLSVRGRERVDAALDELLGGATPEALERFSTPGRGSRVLGGVGAALDFTGSAVRSGLNQLGQVVNPGAARSVATGGATQRTPDRAADELGVQGFLAGLSTGEDTVTGQDLLGPVGDLTDRIPDLRIPEPVPVVGGVNLPDIDTLLGLGAEVATDPLSFARAPGFLARSADGVGFASRSTPQLARLGRFGSAQEFRDRALAADLPAATINRGIDSIESGGLTSFVRDFADTNVPELVGIQTGLSVGGRQVPLTGRVTRALGGIRTGAIGGNVPIIGRISDAITQSAWGEFALSLNDRALDSMDRLELAEIGKASAGISRDLMSRASDVANSLEERLGGLFDDLDEEALRELTEIGGDQFQEALDSFVDFADGEGFTMAQFAQDPTLLDRFASLEDITPRTALLAGPVAFMLAEVDSIATKFRPGSQTPRALIGHSTSGPGLLNRRAGSLRQLANNVATLRAFDNVGRLADSVPEIGQAQLRELEGSLFQLSDVPVEVAEAFGIGRGILNTGLVGLRDVTGNAPGLADEFTEMARASIADSYNDLANGNLTNIRTRLTAMSSRGQAHLDALSRSINDLVAGQGKAYIQGLDRRFGRANTRRAQAMGDAELAAEAERIIFNQWFNPTLGSAESPLTRARLFPQHERAVLAVAGRRNLDSIMEPITRLQSWLSEWTAVAQETGAQFDRAFSPRIARQMRDVNDWYNDALLTHRIFGEAAQTALGGARARGLEGAGVIPEEAATAIGQWAMDFHYRAGPEFFGPDAGQWAEAMHENSRFLNSLQREGFTGSGPAEFVLDKLAKFNRAFFRGQATFGPGFMLRNFKGQVRLNFLAGARVTGRGGYREWQPYYELARRALREETVGLTGQRTSDLWKEIPEGDRDLVQQIAYGGILTSNSASGNLIDRAFDIQERSLGRVTGAVSDSLAAGQNRIEQVVAAGVERATSGGRSAGLRGRDLLNNAEGLQASTRRELETYMRGALAWSVMAGDGQSIDAALNAISRNHFDYWDLTQAGQRIDEVMPFYVFRARITRLAAELALSSPGIPITSYRFFNSSDQRDPFGAGQRDNYTFGVGQDSRGISWEFRPDDPLTEGFDTIGNVAEFATSGFAASEFREFAFEEGIEPLTPALRLPILSSFMAATGRDGTYEDSFRPVRLRDGLAPRLVEQIADTPLSPLLEATGHLRVVDGEPFITSNGANYLTDSMPLLGRIEGALYAQLLGDGERPEEEELTRRTLNTWFSFTGVPFVLIDEQQRSNVARGVGFDIGDYDRLVSRLGELREEIDGAETGSELGSILGD